MSLSPCRRSPRSLRSHPPAWSWSLANRASFAAAIVDKTGDEIEGDETITWTTSDPAVLTVDQFGIIKSVGADGAAFVTATGGDFTASIGVFVGTAPTGAMLSRAAPHDWVYGV